MTRCYPALRRQCLHEVGIVVDDAVKSDGIIKYESWFQLTFRDGEVWDLQDQIFTICSFVSLASFRRSSPSLSGRCVL